MPPPSAELYPNWAYVSLPTGAAGAAESMPENLDWLQGHDEIVLMFDDDEPGRDSRYIRLRRVLPPGKGKDRTSTWLNHKDASDALQANDLIGTKGTPCFGPKKTQTRRNRRRQITTRTSHNT